MYAYAYNTDRNCVISEPRSRPTARQVCHHPFFWSGARRLDFFVHLSDRLELEPPDALSVMLLETEAQSLLGRGWNRKLDPSLMEDMGRYRKYDTCSVRDLLRVIRNKRSHYNELSEQVKTLVGELPEGFVRYFETRFPRLLLHCVRVACTHYAHEKDLNSYCLHIATMFRISTPVAALNNINMSTSVNMNVGQGQLLDQDPACSYTVWSTGNSIAVRGVLGNSISSSSSSHHSGSASVSQKPEQLSMYDGMTMNANSSNAVTTMETLGSNNLFYAHDMAQTVIAGVIDAQTIAEVSEEESTQQAIAAVTTGNMVVWHGSGFAVSCKTVGWWRDDLSWISQPISRQGKPRPSHLTRSSTDTKYRSRLCTHWDMTQECQFRKKGKCDFAHGPLELRIKDTRRDKWGQISSSSHSASNSGHGSSNSQPQQQTATALLRYSGGEDVLGAARSIEKVSE